MFIGEHFIVSHGEVVLGGEAGGRYLVSVRVQVAVALAIGVAVVRDQQVCARAEYWTATVDRTVL